MEVRVKFAEAAICNANTDRKCNRRDMNEDGDMR